MNKEEKNLKYKPLKDTLAIFISLSIIIVIFLVCFFISSQNKNGTYYAKIKYQNTELWDKDDESTKENKLIPFPKNGTKVLIYKRSDGPIFLGENNYFEFYESNDKDKRDEPQIEVTLYSDISIEITYQKSPKNICENIGRTYNTYTPLVCLPNSFQVSIVKSDIKSDTLPDFDN